MKRLIAGLIKWKPKADAKVERASPSRTVVSAHEIAVRHAQAREKERADAAAVEPAHGNQHSRASARKDRPGRAKKRGERKIQQGREGSPVQASPKVDDPPHRKPPSARDEVKEASTDRETLSRKRKRRAMDSVRTPEEEVRRRRTPAPGLTARAAGRGTKSEKVRRRLRQVTFGGNLLQDAEASTHKRKKKVSNIKLIRGGAGEAQPRRAPKGARRKTALDHL